MDVEGVEGRGGTGMGEDHAGQRAPLGRALSQARSARGMSVADVAAAINLRETVVRAIERDDFALCGGHVYARGHLRAYARQVGLDAGPLLAIYAARYQRADAEAGLPPAEVRPADGSTQPSDTRPSDTRPSDTRPVPALAGSARTRLRGDVPLERRGPNWAVVTGFALTVVLLMLVVALIGDLRAPGRGATEVASPSSSAPTPSSSAPSPTSSRTTGPTPSTSPAATPGSSKPGTPAPGGVAVALRATGQSWVSVRDAVGRTVFSGLLSKGDARRFSDGKTLRLTLGNAGAVQLTVNGTPIGSAGDDGQVVRLRFGPGDPT